MAPSILSQREIDALLAALPTEEATPHPMLDAGRPNKPVKPYDFRHPQKFSNDQIRTIENLHVNFARRLGSALSALLKSVVDINLIGTEPSVYEEFVRQVPNPAVLYTMTLDPLPGRAIVELHPSVAFVIVDRILGGMGKALNKTRELTDVEVALLEQVIYEILGNIKEAWVNVTPLLPKLGDIASTPQFLQIALPTETVVVVSFEVRVLESTGIMRLCLPHPLLEPIIPQLSANAWLDSTRKELLPEKVVALRRRLDRVRVPAVVILGETELSVDEVMHLQVGDVIPLSSLVKQDLDVLIAGKLKFQCRPGLSGRKVAVKVTEVVEEEEGDDGTGN